MDVLFVNCCMRENSRTLRLAQRVLDKINGQVEEVYLGDGSCMPLNRYRLALRDKLTAEGQFDAQIFDNARRFAAADTIVIAAPYWDFSFPAVLKDYLETVTAVGVTFRYSPEGIPIGMCKAKKLVYITTAGGHIAGPDLGFGYVDALARNLYGIKDTVCFKCEKLDIYGEDVEALLNVAEAEIDAWQA